LKIVIRSQKRLEVGQNQVLQNQMSMQGAHEKLQRDATVIKDGQDHIRHNTDLIVEKITTMSDLTGKTIEALDNALQANNEKILFEFIEKNPSAVHEILETRQNVRFLGCMDKHNDLNTFPPHISGPNFQRNSKPSMGH
jgi:uncharacterized protein (DUF849 family)